MAIMYISFAVLEYDDGADVIVGIGSNIIRTIVTVMAAAFSVPVINGCS